MQEVFEKIKEKIRGNRILHTQINETTTKECEIVFLDAALESVDQVAEEYSNDGWVPCSERLPEYGQYVLANTPPKESINGGRPIVIVEFRKDNEHLFMAFVTAWQPLPAPYQPKGEK